MVEGRKLRLVPWNRLRLWYDNRRILANNLKGRFSLDVAMNCPSDHCSLRIRSFLISDCHQNYLFIIDSIIFIHCRVSIIDVFQIY